MNNNIYKDVIVTSSVSLPAFLLETEIYDCTQTDGHGSNALRAIFMPPGFVTSDISFKVYFDSIGSGGGYDLYLTDGTDRAPYRINAAMENQCIALLPQFFDFIRYFTIVLSAPQPLGTQIILQLAPIYQGIA